MKYLRKINKGFALTVVVVLILIIYIISVEISRNADKTAIESAIKDYIVLVNDCAILLEKDQKLYDLVNLSEEQKMSLLSLLLLNLIKR